MKQLNHHFDILALCTATRCRHSMKLVGTRLRFWLTRKSIAAGPQETGLESFFSETTAQDAQGGRFRVAQLQLCLDVDK